MSANNSTLQERASEIRASSEVAMLSRILNDAVLDPSTKRFVNSRASRIERWLQLESVARQQVSGLQALSKSAKPRVAKRPTVAATGTPITTAETEAKAS